MYRFEWDETKAEANRKKHGVSFRAAAMVFSDPAHFTVPDDRFEYDEESEIPFGQVEDASLRSSTPSVKAKSESFPHDTPKRPKPGRTIRFTLDPNNLPKLTRGQLGDLRRMTEAQIIAAAKSDPDNPPLTEAELKQFKRAVPPPDAKAIRKATGLSQSAFAWRYGFDVSAVRDWEQGRRTPDRAARVLLAIIKYEPKAVERALAAYALSPYQKRGQARS